MGRRPRVAIVTAMPRAQRVEVYNEMARTGELDFRVFYLQKLSHGRLWEYGPAIEHDAVFIPEVRIHRQLYFNPGFSRQLARLKPDLTIVTGYYAPAMQLAMYLETLRDRRWVFWAEMANTRFAEHATLRSEALRDVLRWVALLPVRHFPTEIWAVGTRAQKDYRRLVRPAVPVRNLPYYADLDRFFSAGDRRESAPLVRFLFSGSLIERKGADVVAAAAARLVEDGYRFELHVAGAGPLESLFRALPMPVRECVHLYGFVQLDHMPELYGRADVLLFPSRHDGWGMTLGEGMAAGLAPISTDQTGSAIDMIENGRNGVRIPELTLDRLIHAMRFFLDEPARITDMGGAARERAKDFTHRVGARRFIAAIASCL